MLPIIRVSCLATTRQASPRNKPHPQGTKHRGDTPVCGSGADPHGSQRVHGVKHISESDRRSQQFARSIPATSAPHLERTAREPVAPSGLDGVPQCERFSVRQHDPHRLAVPTETHLATVPSPEDSITPGQILFAPPANDSSNSVKTHCGSRLLNSPLTCTRARADSARTSSTHSKSFESFEVV